jgi:SAM-dependent methyltransferase
MPVEAPFPPRELAERVGALQGDDLVEYEEVGKAIRAEILAVLPADWTFAGKRVLDFGCGAGRTLRHFLEEAESATFYGSDIDAASIAWLEASLSPPLRVFANGETPPLPLEADSLDLIWAISVFTHIADHWAAWLLELHRLLRDGGLLIATILGPGLSAEWAEVPPDPRAERGETLPGDGERVGMNVLHYGRSWDQGGPLVFLSRWWIEEHWGRAFDILTLREEGFAAALPGWIGQGLVLARKRPGEITAAELERIDPSERREIEALRHNIRQLHHKSKESCEAREWLEGERAALTEQLARSE